MTRNPRALKSVPASRECSECGKPMLVTPGTRHASCSPRCHVCYDPVLSTDPTNDTRVHAGCAKKRPTDQPVE